MAWNRLGRRASDGGVTWVVGWPGSRCPSPISVEVAPSIGLFGFMITVFMVVVNHHRWVEVRVGSGITRDAAAGLAGLWRANIGV